MLFARRNQCFARIIHANFIFGGQLSVFHYPHHGLPAVSQDAAAGTLLLQLCFRELPYYEMDNRYEEIKEWYDGYRFGNADVYCPWDVVNYCNDHLNNPNAKPENYWMNTSGNNVINHFIDSVNEPDMLTKTELEWLVNGKIVRKRVDEMVTYSDLYSSMDNLWSTLFMTGYLTQRGQESDGRFCLAIPNREIRNIITECVLTLFRDEVKKDGEMAIEIMRKV